MWAHESRALRRCCELPCEMCWGCCTKIVALWDTQGVGKGCQSQSFHGSVFHQDQAVMGVALQFESAVLSLSLVTTTPPCIVNPHRKFEKHPGQNLARLSQTPCKHCVCTFGEQTHAMKHTCAIHETMPHATQALRFQ